MDTPRFFLLPNGSQWRLDRAITRDNWITWRHALPRVETDCLTVRYGRLTTETTANIKRLAKGLHGALLELRPRGIDDCPWTVYRWWRYRDGEPFATGGACEFSVQGLDADDLIAKGPRHGLTIQALFGSMLMAQLKN